MASAIAHALPVSELRAGDIFLDTDTAVFYRIGGSLLIDGEWHRAETSARETYITFLDMGTGRYEWRADGHTYNVQLKDKRGETLHVWVLR